MFNNSMIRKYLRKARDLFIFFKAGHSGYLVFFISIINFTVIQYNLLISQIPFLSKFIPDIIFFMLLFIMTYFPLAILIGIFEFKKGTLARRPKLNPYIQSVVESTILFREGLIEGDEGKIRKSVEIMEKWKEIL